MTAADTNGQKTSPEPRDARRRQALARLGLGVAAAYAAPTVLRLKAPVAAMSCEGIAPGNGQGKGHTGGDHGPKGKGWGKGHCKYD